MYDCIDVFKPVDRGWVSPGFSHLLTFMGPVPGIFVSSVRRREGDVMKNMEITSTRKDRLPEIFKMLARFLICSLGHLFQAQLASWKRVEKFDRHYSSRIFIKRAWVWVQFPRKIIHNKWKSITQCHFRFIGNASRCIHTSCVIPFTVTPYKSA